MTREPDHLLDLAARAADGEAVDWGAEAARSHDDAEERVVRALGFLSGVLEAHRTLHGEPVGAAAAGAAGETAGAARWGSLEVLEEIGRGSFGTVHRARDRRLDRVVALKLWPAPPDTSEGVVSEGRLLAKVRHPNVVTVHGAEYHDGRFGLWMEHVDGVTLSALLRERGPFGAGEAVAAGLDLCGALSAVHAAGLVHGDMKAQNVMRESGGRLVLMDFSAGRDLARHESDDAPTVSGTPLFMAPEVLVGGPKTVASDIYALGVLLYHLLTGAFPVEGASVQGLRKAHAAGERTPLRDRRPELPAGLVEVVERAAAAEPADRFATAGELEQALRRVQVPPAAAPAPRRSLAPRLAVVAALVLVAAALVVVFWPRSGRAPSEPATFPSSSADPLAAAVDTTLYRAGMATREALAGGDRIRPGDRLFLEVRAREPVYLYVVNLDETGAAYLLFPLPEAQATNPLAAGVTQRLPGDTDAAYDSWEVSSAGGRESFLIVASAERLDRFEADLAEIARATPDGPAAVAPEMIERLRGVGNLSRVGVAAKGDAAEVARALESLASSPPTRDRVVVREIVLENP